jgi:hypothetical protein
MIANSAFLAAMIVVLLLLSLMGELRYLAPYRHYIFPEYLWVILGAVGIVFLNLFVGIYFITRWLCLKGTGRKLRHLERQLPANDAVARDLAERLEED